MSTTKLMTADELLHLPDDGWRYELIGGVLIRMSPAGWEHNEIEGEIYHRFRLYLHQHRLGRAFSGDTGFIFGRSPDTVLMPDVAFVRQERLPAGGNRKGFVPVVPDLAVEVRSPTNTWRALTEKVQRYMDGGVRIVWIVDPERRVVTVYEVGQPPVELGEHDTLDGGSVLPGFRLPLSELWDAE